MAAKVLQPQPFLRPLLSLLLLSVAAALLQVPIAESRVLLPSRRLRGTTLEVGGAVSSTGSKRAHGLALPAPLAGRRHLEEKDNGPIYFKGGPVMAPDPVSIHFIYYGSWSSGQNILENFVKSLADSSVESPSVSSWWQVLTAYTDGSGNNVSSSINLASTSTDAYSQGTVLTKAALQSVVQAQIDSNQLPEESNAIYVVPCSADVTTDDGFCSQYCGYHDHFVSSSGTQLKFAFIGNPGACSACITSANKDASPNSDPNVDAMVSVLAHEIIEATTDPELNAWGTAKNSENGDICAWEFGETLSGSDGNVSYEWNLQGSGDMRFLVQMTYDPNLQRCVLQSGGGDGGGVAGGGGGPAPAPGPAGLLFP